MKNSQNNTIAFSLIAVFVMAVMAATVFLLMQGSEESSENESSTSRTEQETANNTQTGEPSGNEDRQTTAGMGDSSGVYTDYSPELVSSEAYANRIIFFKSDWCPTCSVLDRDIKENLADIPQGTIILEADYDDETELRREYGVTTQHTLILVDQNGDEIKKWAGSFNLKDVLSQAEII
ncbi:MAG: thioredoxin family protein [Candidatus Dojkabacteria bacterium]